MRTERRVLCTYHGYFRVLCPVVLGHTHGREKALTFQVAGGSKSGLPPEGQWRCMFLDEVQGARLQDGAWRVGDEHSRPQGCVEDVDLDINPMSPYNPKRRLQDTRVEIELNGPGKFAVDVVGVSQYQRVIEAAGEKGDVVMAMLVLEDSNPYDDQAVAVHLGGQRAGYLSRANARAYRADLAAAGEPAATVRCKAKIVGGFETRDGARAHFGLKLDLPKIGA